MGWNQGAMGITKFLNQHGITINIVKNYGQIDEPTLKAHCSKFCKSTGAKFQMHTVQNNCMMVSQEVICPQPPWPTLSPTKHNTYWRALSMQSSCIIQS